ncbi:MAG: histidine phosphatase family protein [Alphaproteobacteria bacterium]|nr:histidine phosphatase family protein [Alphaproteobacteria bacterium]
MTKNLHYWLVRHAPINAFDDNGIPTDNRFIGQLDIACDLCDADAIKWLIGALPQQASLLTSHLQRAKKTADKLLDAGLQVTHRSENSAFAEQNFGDWQGMDYDSHYQYHRDYWHDVINNIPPNGESFEQLCQRVNQAMMHCYNQANTHQPNKKQNGKKQNGKKQNGKKQNGKKQNSENQNSENQNSENQNIIIIGHAGSIRAAIADCNQQTPESTLQYNIAPLSLTHLHFYQKDDSVIKEVITINSCYDTNEGVKPS